MTLLKRRQTGFLMVLASAAGFATLAIFIKIAYAAGANLMTVLIFRFVLASVLFGLILKVQAIRIRLSVSAAVKICLLGAIGYSSMSFLFAASLKYLPASLASMLLYTYPAIVCLLAFLLGDERLNGRKLAALAFCIAGLYFVLGSTFDDFRPLGIILGLGSAAVYSCYIVIGNRLLKQVRPLVATLFVCASAAMVFGIWGSVTHELTLNLPISGWLALIGIALLPTCLGILGFFAGMNRVGPADASIISTVEPVITVLMAVGLLGDVISGEQIGGGLLILGGILILQLENKVRVHR